MRKKSFENYDRDLYSRRYPTYDVISSGSEKDLLRTSRLLNDVGSFLSSLLQTFRNSKVEKDPKKKILKKVIPTLASTAKQIDVILNFIYDKEALRNGRRLSYDMKRIADELTYFDEMKDSEFTENEKILSEIVGLFGEINFSASDFGDTLRHLIQKNKYKDYSGRY